MLFDTVVWLLYSVAVHSSVAFKYDFEHEFLCH